MTARPVARTAEMAANEPVTVAAVVRAAVYTLLVRFGVDAEIIAVAGAVLEVVLAYVTRRAVTPVKRSAEAQAAALPTSPPTEETQRDLDSVPA